MRSQKHVKRQRRNKWIKRTLFSIMILVFFIFGTGVGYYGSEIMRVLSDVSERTPRNYKNTLNKMLY